MGIVEKFYKQILFDEINELGKGEKRNEFSIKMW